MTRTDYKEYETLKDGMEINLDNYLEATKTNLNDLNSTKVFGTTQKVRKGQVWTERNINPLDV